LVSPWFWFKVFNTDGLSLDFQTVSQTEKPRRVPGPGFVSISILENGAELIGAFERFISGEEVV
jgi:hypothetical protein